MRSPRLAHALWLALALAPAWFAGCGSGGGSSDGPSAGLSAAPVTVSFTAPAHNERGVALNTSILSVFSDDKDPATVTEATFVVRGPAGPVGGEVAYHAPTRSARFVPADHLSPNVRYTAVLTREVRDTAGTPLPAEYTWSFETGSHADERSPSVVSLETALVADGAATNTTISVTFSEVMDPSSIGSQTITVTDPDGREVEGAVDYSGKTATFTPTEELSPDTAYDVTVGPGGQDLAGNPVEGHSESITTGGNADTGGPTVAGSAPVRDEAGVFRNRAVAVSFSEPISPATATTQSITLRQGSGFVPATVACIGSNVILAPAVALAPNAVYTVTVTEAVKDLAGNAHPGTDSWDFTTGESLDTAPPGVQGTVPAAGAAGVDTGSPIRLTFDEPMNPFVFGAVDGIPGAVTYDFATATFSLIPAERLRAGTRYTATITARDLAGLPTTHRWSFTTAP